MQIVSGNNSNKEAKGYLVFSDEAGGYSYGVLTDKYIKNNPAYIRSYILMSISDYKKYQSMAKKINLDFNIPVGDEIKWSDLGSLPKRNSKKHFINNLKIEGVQNYIRKIITNAIRLESLCPFMVKS